MPTVLRDRLFVVWALLVVATVVSWAVGNDHGSLGAAGVVAAMAIAFIKVRFVGLGFMELKGAPLVLRLLFETWCVVVATVVIVLYLLGSPRTLLGHPSKERWRMSERSQIAVVWWTLVMTAIYGPVLGFLLRRISSPSLGAEAKAPFLPRQLDVDQGRRDDLQLGRGVHASGVRHSPFPRWFGYLTVRIAIMFEAGAIAFMQRSGAFA